MDTVNASVTNVYQIVNGVDNSDGLMRSFNSAEIIRLGVGGDDNDRIQSNGNWPISDTYDESRYLEFIFGPNLNTDYIIDDVKLNHEYYQTVKLSSAKLEVWDGVGFVNYPINLPLSSGTSNEISQSINIFDTIKTANQVNQLRVRFLAYRDTNAVSVKTSHDLLNLVVSYSLPEITPPIVVNPEIVPVPEVEPVVDPEPELIPEESPEITTEDPQNENPKQEPESIIDPETIPMPDEESVSESESIIEQNQVLEQEPVLSENNTSQSKSVSNPVPQNITGGVVLPQYLNNQSISNEMSVVDNQTQTTIATDVLKIEEPINSKEEISFANISSDSNEIKNTNDVKLFDEPIDVVSDEGDKPRVANSASNLALTASSGLISFSSLKYYWLWVILLLVILILVLVVNYKKSK